MKHSPPIISVIESNAGFTIIEALIAIAIFSIGIMAMGSLQSATLITTGQIARKTEAWAVLGDQADTLKGIRFYTNNDDIDNNMNGVTDELTEEDPDMVAGNYQGDTLDGRYTIYWQVVNNSPVPAVVVAAPPAVAAIKEVPPGTYTVSKTISMQVTQAGRPLTPANTLAEVQFVKTWAADGIP